MAVLIVEATKQRIPLDQPQLTIGSGDKSMIQIQDPKLGSLHCQIIKNGGSFKIISLDQATGTFINGIKIREQQLKGGDVIQLGATKLVFQDDGQGAPKSTTAMARPVTQAVARPATQTGVQRPATQTGVQRPPSQPVRQPTQAIAKPVTKAVPTGTQPVARPATQTGLQKPPTGGVKMPTQAVARPGTQPVRSPTQAVQRPSTQAQKSVTQRGKPQTGRAGKRTSRDRSTITAAKIEMHKKKLPMGLKVFGTLFLCIVGGIGLWYLIRDTSDQELADFSAKVVKMDMEAEKLLDEKKYADAVKIYDQIIALTNTLSGKAKEKYGDGAAVYKGKKMHAEKMKTAGSAEAKKVSQFIEEGEAIKADFKLDTAAPFLYKWEWILKATQGDHEKAKALFKELETMRDAATAAIKNWAKDQVEFDKLLKERDYIGARTFVDDFIKACKDPVEVDKAKKSAEQILPYAKEHVGRVRGAIIRKKDGTPIEALRKEWDEAVEKHFKGIVPQADLDKAWDDILKK